MHFIYTRANALGEKVKIAICRNLIEKWTFNYIITRSHINLFKYVQNVTRNPTLLVHKFIKHPKRKGKEAAIGEDALRTRIQYLKKATRHLKSNNAIINDVINSKRKLCLVLDPNYSPHNCSKYINWNFESFHHDNSVKGFPE